MTLGRYPLSISGTPHPESIMQGMRDGVGIMRWEDGTSFEGEWRQDIMQGFGVEVYLPFLTLTLPTSYPS